MSFTPQSGGRSRAKLALALVVVLGATAPVPALAGALPDGTPTGPPSPAGAPVVDPSTGAAERCDPGRPEPGRDALGWEDGCWNDSSLPLNGELELDRTGLNDSVGARDLNRRLNRTQVTRVLNRTELRSLVARTKARIERIRRLEFRADVPVEVVSREEYANRSARYYANFTEERELRENVTWEAAFVVDGRTNATRARHAHDVALADGYYDPERNEVVVVSANRSVVTVDELALAGLLFRALQDQRFDVTDRFGYGRFGYRNRTIDAHSAVAGIVEGDASYVTALYERRCRTAWDCLRPAVDRGDFRDVNFGMRILDDQPGFDGRVLVEGLHDDGGWDAVDAAYRNPPESSEQTIHTGEYLRDSPAEMSFEDTSGAGWRVAGNSAARPRYVTFGEAGIASTLIYPFYKERQVRSPIIPFEGHVNTNGFDNVDTDDPIEYGGNVFSRGWENDRLYPYATTGASGAEKTGYVWKSVWESPADRAEFVEGYLELLAYNGATNVTDYRGVYRIERTESFSGVYYVEESGNTATVVHAPTVADLSRIRTDASIAHVGDDRATPLSPLVGGAVSLAALASLAFLGWIRRTVA